MKKLLFMAIIFLMCANIVYSGELTAKIVGKSFPKENSYQGNGFQPCLKITNQQGEVIFFSEITSSHGYWLNKDFLVIFTDLDNESSSKQRRFIGNVYKYQNGKMLLKCIVFTKQQYTVPNCMASPLYSFKEENSNIGKDILLNLYRVTLNKQFSDTEINIVLKLLRHVKNNEKEQAFLMMKIIGNRGPIDNDRVYPALKDIVENNNEFWFKKTQGGIVDLYYTNDFENRNGTRNVSRCTFSIKAGKIIFMEEFMEHNVLYIFPRPTNYSR